jgi:uncharacterized cupin superfamily protein
MPSIHNPQFDDASEREGFRNRRSRLGRQAGGERLGASLYEVEPGNATFPYHYHFGNEELLVVVRGRPHLRTPEGWRQLEEGEMVAFPVGERGAHQIANRSDEMIRFLLLSEMNSPDMVVYPDSAKIGASENAPGSPGEFLRANFRSSDAVDYWEDEQPPEAAS